MVGREDAPGCERMPDCDLDGAGRSEDARASDRVRGRPDEPGYAAWLGPGAPAPAFERKVVRGKMGTTGRPDLDAVVVEADAGEGKSGRLRRPGGPLRPPLIPFLVAFGAVLFGSCSILFVGCWSSICIGGSDDSSGEWGRTPSRRTSPGENGGEISGSGTKGTAPTLPEGGPALRVGLSMAWYWFLNHCGAS